MSRAPYRCSGRRATTSSFLALLMLCFVASLARAGDGDVTKLTFYPSLQLRFVDGQPHNYFFSQAQVVNVSGIPMTGLVLRQKFPEGMTAKLLSADAQSVFKRPPEFTESLDNNVYTAKLPELRVAEAISLAVELTYGGRPGATTFPGIEVEYSQAGQQGKQVGPDQTWDLSKYTKYSGTLREFIKRYAGVDLSIPNDEEDWGFTNLVARAAGKPSTGPVEIETDTAGRLKFSLQAGAPGSLRQLMLLRRPLDPARQPKATDEVRRFVLDQVQATADFTLDADNISIQKQKVGRLDAWVAQTTWRDRVKDRMGEGPSRWYVFPDEKGANLYVVNISAQGRGAGPGKADAPNPGRDQELMTQLEGIVKSLRLM
ncbi:MAG TPA: hypothetical protein VFE84_12100 [Patescibacteria group bacterium]|nr:hypothetical protein [Patescibacteria group bacterium]